MGRNAHLRGGFEKEKSLEVLRYSQEGKGENSKKEGWLGLSNTG